MDRVSQSWLMVIGCAVLVVAAVLLPVAILRPAPNVEQIQITPSGPARIVEAPIGQIPSDQTIIVPTPGGQAALIQPSPVETPVTQAPTPSPPAAQPSTAQAPTEPPLEQGPTTRPSAAATPRKRSSRTRTAQAPETPPAPEAQTSATDEDFGATRGKAFQRIVQRQLANPDLGSLVTSLDLNFRFPHARDDAVFGIDMSHHNVNACCPFKWDVIASNKVTFVYLKSSEGSSYTDSAFKKNWAELAKHPKIHRGAYHWLRADVSVEKQADLFVSLLGEMQPGDLPPAMDLEWDWYVDSTRKGRPKDGYDYWSNLSADEIVDRALTFLKLVEKKTGRTPAIYTSHEWWTERKIDVKKMELFKRYPLWIASYASADLKLEQPGAKNRYAGQWRWTLWQFTNMGDLTKAGIPNPKNPSSERIDVSLYSGSLLEFQKEMGIASLVVSQNDTPAVPAASPARAKLLRSRRIRVR